MIRNCISTHKAQTTKTAESLNKKEFYNHPVFAKIENVLRSKHFTANIKSLAKKEIADNLIFLEVYRIRQILNQNLKFIYKKNLINYIKSFPEFTGDKITSLFIKEYSNSKQELVKFARRRLTKNNYMTQQDFNKFWSIYTESVNIYEIFLYESLNSLSNKKNTYEVLWSILDKFDILLETQIKTIASELNKLNGRLSEITYKGYKIE